MRSVEGIDMGTEDASAHLPTALFQRRERVLSQRSESMEAFDEEDHSDREAQARVRAVDTPSFHRVYERYRWPIYRFAFRILRSQEDAQDITQEVFVRLFLAWNELRDHENLSAWLYRLATNLSIDHLRRRTRLSWWSLTRYRAGDDQRAEMEEYPSYGLHDSGGIPAIFEREQIRLVLASMPEKDASLLILHAAQGVSYREVGAMVGISPQAAATRLTRAKKMFRERYRQLNQTLFNT